MATVALSLCLLAGVTLFGMYTVGKTEEQQRRLEQEVADAEKAAQVCDQFRKCQSVFYFFFLSCYCDKHIFLLYACSLFRVILQSSCLTLPVSMLLFSGLSPVRL